MSTFPHDPFRPGETTAQRRQRRKRELARPPRMVREAFAAGARAAAAAELEGVAAVLDTAQQREAEAYSHGWEQGIHAAREREP